MNIEELKGKTISEIIREDDLALIFKVSDDEIYKMYHEQSCCETVSIEDICGDLDWLVGTPILVAEERSNDDDGAKNEHDDSHTWTFYELATIKGSVTIRWYGTSNGYYSESVEFSKM